MEVLNKTEERLVMVEADEQLSADGTRIVRGDDGSVTQYEPNGTIIHQFPDGSRRQEHLDGTIIEANEDGSKFVQVNPDGSRLEVVDGVTTIRHTDGTVLQKFPNGEKHQINPSGITIHTYTDGRQMQTSIHNEIEITSYPDGSIDQLDRATGIKLHKRPNGVLVTRS